MKQQKKYTKKEALPIILNAAKKYKLALEGNIILFIYKFNKELKYYEASFSGSNFLHLTGIDSKLSAIDFYDAAISQKLIENDLIFKNDILTSMKLDIISEAVDITKTAKMIGIYNGPRVSLDADVGAGNVRYVMTFRENKNRNTLLYPLGIQKEDVRDVAAQSPIYAILNKKASDKYYKEITYKSKNININKLSVSKELKNVIDEETYKILFPDNGGPPGISDGISTNETKNTEKYNLPSDKGSSEKNKNVENAKDSQKPNGESNTDEKSDVKNQIMLKHEEKENSLIMSAKPKKKKSKSR